MIMKEKIKNCKGGLLGILYVVLCVCSLFFFYIVSGNEFYFVGISGFQLSTLNEIGALAVFLQIFQVFFMFGLIALAMIFVAIVLRAFGIIKFEITFKNIKETSVVKFLMLYQLICAVLVWFFTLLIVVTNNDYSFAFGAGTFILLVICIASYVLQVVFFGKDIDKVEENPQQYDFENQDNLLDITEENPQQDNSMTMES